MGESARWTAVRIGAVLLLLANLDSLGHSLARSAGWLEVDPGAGPDEFVSEAKRIWLTLQAGAGLQLLLVILGCGFATASPIHQFSRLLFAMAIVGCFLCGLLLLPDFYDLPLEHVVAFETRQMLLTAISWLGTGLIHVAFGQVSFGLNRPGLGWGFRGLAVAAVVRWGMLPYPLMIPSEYATVLTVYDIAFSSVQIAALAWFAAAGPAVQPAAACRSRAE